MQRRHAEVVAARIKGGVQQVEVVCRSGEEDACRSGLGLSPSPWLLWHEQGWGTTRSCILRQNPS